jgi:hypothetical protein
MAAIYRFGFEMGVPDGVTITSGDYTTDFTPRYGTKGCSGSVSCALSSELAVKGSFELFLKSSSAASTLLVPATVIALGNVLFKIKNATTVSISVNSNVVAELSVPTIALDHMYEVRFCYVAGSAGMCIFEWDGNELTYDADVSTAITAGVTSVNLCSAVSNSHVIDNVAINNASGDTDSDIPAMTASFYVVPTQIGSAFNWNVASGYDQISAVTTSGGYIYSNTPDSVASYYFGMPSSDVLSKVTFEGIRITYSGLKRTGAILNQGIELGYISSGTDVELMKVPKLSYSARSKTCTVLYDQFGSKINVSAGDSMQAYLKLYTIQ